MQTKTLATLFLLLLLVCAAIFAQNIFGSIAGIVVDSAGLAIPDADITLINIATGIGQTAKSNDVGAYRFVNLTPGVYRVTVEVTGFKKFVRDNIKLDVENTLRIDVQMEIGSLDQTVEVTAQAPLLQSETSSLGQVVETRQVNELPLNGRNVLNLVSLAPSVVPQGQSQGSPVGNNPFAMGNYQIGGGTANQSSMYYDGIPNNNGYLNMVGIIPTQDAVSEFKVQTNNLSPEFGRFAGGIINLTSKSGTNDIHGAGWEYLRNKVLNANTFFNNASGLGRPPFTQNQFGVNVGGPIILPKIYNGKNKSFFFFAYEGFRLRVGNSSLYSVPLPEWKNGDFSNLRNSSGSLIPIYDALTTRSDPNNSGAVVRDVFAGNVIPASRLDPAAVKLFNLWASPTLSGQPYTHLNNYAANTSTGGNHDQYNARVDHAINDRHRVFGRWSRWNLDNLAVDPYHDFAYPASVGTPEGWTTNHGVVDDTYTFNPTTIMDVRAGLMRVHYYRLPGSLGADLTQYGLPSYMNSGISSQLRALPNLCVQDQPAGSQFCGGEPGSVIGAFETTYSIAPSLTKFTGKHTLKFGGEYRIDQHNFFQTNNASGTMNFGSGFTASNLTNPTGGFGFASYMLGYLAGGGSTIVAPIAAEQKYYGLYASDTWQFSRNLTLNLGIRWEQSTPWTERYDRMVIVDLGATSPLAAATGLPLKGATAYVNSSARSARTAVDAPGLDFSPRIGLAYRVTPKTVIRTGYGIFYLGNNVAWKMSPHYAQVNSTSTTITSSIDGDRTPYTQLSNPFPNGILHPLGRAANLNTLDLGNSVGDPSPNGFKYAYAQQWNFNIQRELGDGLLVDLAYAGSKGTHLPTGGQQVDQLPDQYLSLGTQLQQVVTNPFHNLVASNASLGGATTTRGQLLRPYPQYSGLSLYGEGTGNTIYHSMQLKVEKRFKGGAAVLVAYTISKSIGDSETITNWLESGGVGSTLDNNNLRLDRSVLSFDVPQRLVMSYLYDLPVGQGKKYFSGIGRVPNAFLGGWGLQGVTTLQSGFPLHLGVSNNTSNSYGGGQRPVSTGKTAELTGSATARLSRWFDTSQFVAPQPFTFGNVGRTLPDVRGQGIDNSDFSLIKNTSLMRERANLQFRAEIFNVFNRVQFDLPGQTFGSTSFGVISATVNQPRLVQFGLRLTY